MHHTRGYYEGLRPGIFSKMTVIPGVTSKGGSRVSSFEANWFLTWQHAEAPSGLRLQGLLFVGILQNDL